MIIQDENGQKNALFIIGSSVYHNVSFWQRP